MTSRVAKLLLFFAFTIPAFSAPKFAVVRVSDVYQQLSSTVALSKSLQDQREAIMKEERAEHLRNLVSELQLLQTQFQQKKEAQMTDAMQKLARDFEIKRQQALTLQRDFEAYRTEKNREFNRIMVESMRVSLAKIAAASDKLAREQGFAGAFDSTGSSNTGVPVLLYSKNAKDLTPEVIALLKDAGDPPAASENPTNILTAPAFPGPAPAADVPLAKP